MRLKTLENINPRLQIWLYKIVIAGLITLAIQLVFIYVSGEFSRAFHYTSGIEFIFTFLYFLSLFWIFPKISRFIHSPALKRLKSIYINAIEGVTVVVSVFFLTAIMKILPLWMLLLVINVQYLGTNVELNVDSLRRSLIIHAILGLFFYYFVERERIRKQIRAEHLEYVRLQKESFEAQLENLKNQVNPLFLFNSLDTLDSIIQKSPDTAVEYVEKLSYVYRFFLDQKDQLITLEKELDLIEAYLFLLKIRLKESIMVDLKVEDDHLKYQLPPGSLQSLIENIVNNVSFSEKNPLLIDIYTQDKMLVLQSNFYPIEKSPSGDSTLKKIIARYRLLTDAEVQIVQNNSGNTIELPLLKVEEYQDN